jgi:hypothetical protein
MTKKPSDVRYTVLGEGQAYIKSFKPPRGGGSSDPLPPFSATQARLRPQVQILSRDIARIRPRDRLDEVVIELRMDERFLAKSYRPHDLLHAAGLTMRGIGTWDQEIDMVRAVQRKIHVDPGARATVPSLSIFASGPDRAIARLTDAVGGALGGTSVQDELARIQAIQLPAATERALGFETISSTSAAIELVLFDWDQQNRREATERIRSIILQGGGREEEFLVRSYADGPTFVAAIATPAAMAEVQNLNFLRMARPQIGRAHV